MEKLLDEILESQEKCISLIKNINQILDKLENEK